MEPRTGPGDPRAYDYSRPTRSCDVVMKGGITSGVVYPHAICELARTYRFVDVGGTSTDVCLVAGGRPERSTERVVGGFPIRLPSVDVHTIGAGGGSIVWRDPGGAERWLQYVSLEGTRRRVK